MVAINFSPEFAGPVERGEKRQTIRRTARCKPGDRLHLYTGQRTKNCRKLLEAICVDVRPVRISAGSLHVDGACLMADTANDFAIADGFEGYGDMWNWFSERYRTSSFTGYVIRW